MYIDENDFRRKSRSLRKYSMQSYKELVFKVLKGNNVEKEDGKYTKELWASESFKFLYGAPKVHYSIKNGVMILEDLEPQQFLLDGYVQDLDEYKGMYYRDLEDKKKIDFYLKLKNLKVIEK